MARTFIDGMVVGFELAQKEIESAIRRYNYCEQQLEDSRRTVDNLTKGKQASGKRIAQLEEKVARLAMYISLYYMPTYSVPNKEK